MNKTKDILTKPMNKKTYKNNTNPKQKNENQEKLTSLKHRS
jgi:hypothetical protein